MNEDSPKPALSNKTKVAGGTTLLATGLALFQCWSEMQSNKKHIEQNSINCVSTEMWITKCREQDEQISLLRERLSKLEK